jgi:flavodoxin II
MKTAPIGLFYGSSTCYTEMAAEKIQQQFPEASVDMFNVADTPVSTMIHYQQLILGIPTWDYGELQEDWEDIWDDLDTVDLSQTTVAIFGLGDQVGYPDWFLDAMGYLHNKVVVQGAKVIGYWPNKGYEYNESQALTEDKQYFFGLALDDENEFDQTDQRITQWCDDIKQHFSIER